MGAAYSDPNSVSIPVSAEAATSFHAMSAEKQEILRRVMGQRMEQALKSTNADLFALMEKASGEAEKNGLTPELLQEILNEA